MQYYLKKMKTATFKLLTIFLLTGLLSCEETNRPDYYRSYTEYLSDKAIISIGIFDNTVWILSIKECDTCYVHPFSSHVPTISQLTAITQTGFNFQEPAYVGTPVMDNQGNLFTALQNKIYKIKSLGNYELVLEPDGFQFNYFTFDKNNHIWMGGDKGLAYWDGNELTRYNISNSILPSNITHGIALDHTGNVWVTLDFKGLLKISGDKWEVIPNAEIPGLKSSSYLSAPIVDNDNNIWFSVFTPDTTSNILRYDGLHWNYEYLGTDGYGMINRDSKGAIWIIQNIREDHVFKYPTLSYLKNGVWNNFDVSGIASQILTVNSDENKVYIGTVKGLYVVNKK